MTRPIELWFWPTPNGWKVSIALEEMGLPYELKPVNIGAGEQFEPAFQAISPNGRMPAIVDHGAADGRPLSIFESGAILQHLGRKAGRFYPQDERARAECERGQPGRVLARFYGGPRDLGRGDVIEGVVQLRTVHAQAADGAFAQGQQGVAHGRSVSREA